jgi:LPS-assembly lipoprotein
MGLTAFMLRFLSLLSVLALAACGFTPLYGERQAAPALASVVLDNMQGRDGQQLRLLLSDRFYGAQAPSSAQWRLGVKVTSSKEDLGIRRDDVATRARRVSVAQFTLTRVGEDKPALSGTERSFVSYNIFLDPYATESAEANAQERALTQLADLITNRVALTLTSPDQ